MGRGSARIEDRGDFDFTTGIDGELRGIPSVRGGFPDVTPGIAVDRSAMAFGVDDAGDTAPGMVPLQNIAVPGLGQTVRPHDVWEGGLLQLAPSVPVVGGCRGDGGTAARGGGVGGGSPG
jgi:hypothetical protein